MLVDLCCKAGGAAVGYARAGFTVEGVDNEPQPRFPFRFHEADALEFLEACIGRGNRLPDGRPVDAYHGSPPCQPFSAISNCRPGLAASYADLVAPMRELLEQSGLPYILENVPGSPLRPDVVLCGHMFGRALYRHRIFESNVPLTAPEHPAHVVPASRAGHWTPGTIISIAGNVAPMALARDVMDMHWTNRRELAEAIPPYYTQHLGEQLLAAIGEDDLAA